MIKDAARRSVETENNFVLTYGARGINIFILIVSPRKGCF
jgi:hypothetical protein